MTRKDFELIARTIRQTRQYQLDSQLIPFDKLVTEFAFNLASTNPRFDHDRFVRACFGVDIVL
jgi:hypothetical protein